MPLRELAPTAYERVFVAYADCGTGGALDAVLADTRRRAATGRALLRVLQGNEAFAALARRRAGDLLPDRLPRQALRRVRVARPRSRPPPGAPARQYFGNYSASLPRADRRRRPASTCRGKRPSRLGLAYEDRRTGLRRPRPVVCSASSEASPAGLQLTVICWRDIPAQVTAKDGAGRARAVLPERFQEAIDAAAMRPGQIGTDAYIAEWRRSSASVRRRPRRRGRPRRPPGSRPRTPTTSLRAPRARPAGETRERRLTDASRARRRRS